MVFYRFKDIKIQQSTNTVISSGVESLGTRISTPLDTMVKHLGTQNDS